MLWFWVIFAVLFSGIFYFVFKAFYQNAKSDEMKNLSKFQRIKASTVPMELVIWISFAILAVILAVAKWGELLPSQ